MLDQNPLFPEPQEERGIFTRTQSVCVCTYAFVDAWITIAFAIKAIYLKWQYAIKQRNSNAVAWRNYFFAESILRIRTNFSNGDETVHKSVDWVVVINDQWIHCYFWNCLRRNAPTHAHIEHLRNVGELPNHLWPATRFHACFSVRLGIPSAQTLKCQAW